MNKYGITPYLFALVVIFLMLDLCFVIVANKTFSGVYTEGYYQKGLDFDKINKQEIYDAKVGWKADISFNRESNKVTLVLKDKDNTPIHRAKVQLKIISPVTDKFDLVLFLNEEAAGIYTANLHPRSPGQWDIRIKATLGDKEYIMTKRIMYHG